MENKSVVETIRFTVCPGDWRKRRLSSSVRRGQLTVAIKVAIQSAVNASQ